MFHYIDEVSRVRCETDEERRAIALDEAIGLNDRRKMEMVDTPIVEQQINIGPLVSRAL